MIGKDFEVQAGGRHFIAKEDSTPLPPALLYSATLDLLFGKCMIIGTESVDEPNNEGMIFVIQQNFGRYLILLIERDWDDEKNGLTLTVNMTEAEEVNK